MTNIIIIQKMLSNLYCVMSVIKSHHTNFDVWLCSVSVLLSEIVDVLLFYCNIVCNFWFYGCIKHTLYTYSLDSHGCCYRQIFCYCEISRGGDFYAWFWFIDACIQMLLLLSFPHVICNSIVTVGGSVAEWLACWTQAQKSPGSNRTHDAVG